LTKMHGKNLRMFFAENVDSVRWIMRTAQE
jgi:hypothetical protein